MYERRMNNDIVAHTSSNTKFREKSTKPVPRLHSDELVDRVQKYPLSKNELVEYLIRL